MKKERVILDRLGTLFVLSLLPFFFKMVITCSLAYVFKLFPRFYECILFSIAIYASDNLNVAKKMAELDF